MRGYGMGTAYKLRFHLPLLITYKLTTNTFSIRFLCFFKMSQFPLLFLLLSTVTTVNAIFYRNIPFRYKNTSKNDVEMNLLWQQIRGNKT